MAILVGALLAIAVGAFATVSGLDRDRAFYPTVMIVIAVLYSLFATMGASTKVLLLECAAGTVFLALAVVGFRRSLWLVVLALAGHGVFDLFHGRIIPDPGVPSWWPPFCLTYDVTAAADLAWLIKIDRIRSS